MSGQPTDLTATWVPNAEPPEPPNNHISWLGGMSSNPTWDEYVECFDSEFRPVLEAIKSLHYHDNLDLYGEDLSMDIGGYFLLSDGRSVSMSMRAWGDFRQAMEGKREGYMKYYMRGA